MTSYGVLARCLLALHFQYPAGLGLGGCAWAALRQGVPIGLQCLCCPL